MRGTYKSDINIIISISGCWKDSNQIRKLINDSTRYQYFLTKNYLFHKEEKKNLSFTLRNIYLR